MGAAHTELITGNADVHGRPRAPGLRVALPNLQIPVFAGESREWKCFWEHYEATIHSHPDLADIEKFQYLKSYLARAAKRAIEGIRLTDANYKIAVKVLTDRYGRKDVLIDDHIESLLSIEPIESPSEVARLRDLYKQIQFRIGCLDTLGMSSAEYAVVLQRVLMRSLPEDLAILYRKRTKNDTAGADSAAESREEQLKVILKFLQEEVESR